MFARFWYGLLSADDQNHQLERWQRRRHYGLLTVQMAACAGYRSYIRGVPAHWPRARVIGGGALIRSGLTKAHAFVGRTENEALGVAARGRQCNPGSASWSGRTQLALVCWCRTGALPLEWVRQVSGHSVLRGGDWTDAHRRPRLGGGPAYLLRAGRWAAGSRGGGAVWAHLQLHDRTRAS